MREQITKGPYREEMKDKQRYILGSILILWLLFLGLYGAKNHYGLPRGLTGAYYANPRWEGTPAFTTLDPTLSLARVRERKSTFPQKNYSVRWTGWLYVRQAGPYVFKIKADDGFFLTLDGQPIAKRTPGDPPQPVSQRVTLPKGFHSLTFGYFQLLGTSALEVYWTGPERPEGDRSQGPPLPSTVLFPEKPTHRQFRMDQGLQRLLQGLWILLPAGSFLWLVWRVRQVIPPSVRRPGWVFGFTRPLSKPRKVVFSLLVAFLSSLSLTTASIAVSPTSWKDTLLAHRRFLSMTQSTDSWEPMRQAFHYLQSDHQKPLYSEIFFDKKIKFQYPPTSLLLLYFFQKSLSLSWPDTLKVFSWISWIFVLLTAFFVIKIFNLSLEETANPDVRSDPTVDLVARSLLLLGLTLTFYPVIRAYSLGQIQAWVNFLFTVLLWCWMKDKKIISGILVGGMSLIKPQYLIIFLWGLLRKQWIFLLAFATTLLAGFLVSVSLFGIADHVDYLSVLSFLSRHGEGFYPNQSVNGLLNRLFLNGNNLEWRGDSFPPFHPWVYLGTLLSSLTLMSIALLGPARAGEKGTATDLSMIALTGTMASPIAWEHHYGILLPIYAFLLPRLLEKKIFGERTLSYLYGSYLLSSNYFPMTKKLASYTPLNVVQSYLLVGGLIVFVYLQGLRQNVKD